ncbi:MAG: 30S ribosomal protein S13 [Candidatus Peregrinibacteria bacterium]
MARIAGVNLPNKRMVIALTYIYGVGLPRSQEVLKKLGISEDVRAHTVSEDDVQRIRKELESFLVEGDLRQKVAADIRRLQDIACYRGRRHRLGLPCRGQQTKTNCRTKKGKKRTVANKKK